MFQTTCCCNRWTVRRVRVSQYSSALWKMLLQQQRRRKCSVLHGKTGGASLKYQSRAWLLCTRKVCLYRVSPKRKKKQFCHSAKMWHWNHVAAYPDPGFETKRFTRPPIILIFNALSFLIIIFLHCSIFCDSIAFTFYRHLPCVWHVLGIIFFVWKNFYTNLGILLTMSEYWLEF
jgi:hypothetical protein